MVSEIERADVLLEGCGDVHTQFSEYRATHGYLHVLLTDGDFQRRGDVYLTDCEFIAGPTSGGPWTVRVRERADKQGVAFYAVEGGLEVRAGRIRVELDGGRR